jgi:hypothetical protein
MGKGRKRIGVTEGEDCGADGACEGAGGTGEISEQEQVKVHERENVLQGEVECAAREVMVKASAPVLSESSFFECVRSWYVFSSVV